MRNQNKYAGKPVRDYTGKIFGKVKVLKKITRTGSGFPTYLCKCECGNVHTKTRPERSVACDECRGLRPYESLYNRLRSSKHTVELTYEQFVVLTNTKECHYCSAPIMWVSRASKSRQASRCNLDRKDSTKSYTVSNCVVCCTRCNRAKNNHFTYAEWRQIGALIKTWHT